MSYYGKKEIDQVESRYVMRVTFKTDSLRVLYKMLGHMQELESYAGAISADCAWSYQVTRNPDKEFSRPAGEIDADRAS